MACREPLIPAERESMKVFVMHKPNGKYSYLLNWKNPETGAMMGQWFQTMKDLKEYIRLWYAIIVVINE